MLGFSRRKLIVVVMLLVIIIGGLVAWKFWPRSYSLTVTSVPEIPGYTFRIYSAGTENATDGGNRKPVAEFTKPQTVVLKKGQYLVVGGTPPDFTEDGQSVNLSKDQTISITPQYSKEKLASLLSQESGAIQAAARSSISGLNDSYAIGTGELFGLGDWYGTVIYPNLSTEQLRLQYVDTYRLVMKKEGNTWKAATNPPELILGSPSFPLIPKYVLDATNNQKIP